MAISKPPEKPDLAKARQALGRACGTDTSPLLNNDLFNAVDEMIDYIRTLEARIVELEGAAGRQLTAD